MMKHGGAYCVARPPEISMMLPVTYDASSDTRSARMWPSGLDVIPLQFRVLVIRRPKYACRTCPGTVVQALAPPRLIEGGLPTKALVAHVIVAKYADHTPLYRQAQIYARQGDRSRPLDAGGLDRPRRLVATTAACEAARRAAGLAQALRQQPRSRSLRRRCLHPGCIQLYDMGCKCVHR